MKPYERLRESPSHQRYSIDSRFPDVKLLVFNSETRDFCPGKKLLPAKVDSEGCPQGEPSGRVKIKELRGGVHRYAAQASPQIDTARAKKNRFRMKTM